MEEMNQLLVKYKKLSDKVYQLNKKILKIIEKEIQQLLPEDKISIEFSYDDNRTILVYVYNVPDDKQKRKNIQNVIERVQDKMFRKGEFILLSMLKTPEVTKKYYPEYYKETVLDIKEKCTTE